MNSKQSLNAVYADTELLVSGSHNLSTSLVSSVVSLLNLFPKLVTFV